MQLSHDDTMNLLNSVATKFSELSNPLSACRPFQKWPRNAFFHSTKWSVYELEKETDPTPNFSHAKAHKVLGITPPWLIEAHTTHSSHLLPAKNGWPLWFKNETKHINANSSIFIFKPPTPCTKLAPYSLYMCT